MEISKYIDHTILKPDATSAQIQQLCKDAIRYNFKAVCVNGSYVELAKSILKNTEVEVCSVIGFPLGASSTDSKVFESEKAVDHGAGEIDMVINQGWMKDQKYTELIQEIGLIKKAIGAVTLKVILETCNLTDEEIITATKLSCDGGADYIKTSTGFGSRGASLNDIALIKQGIAPGILIKASGGIKDYDTALSYINAGVSRIGTSNGITIAEAASKQ